METLLEDSPAELLLLRQQKAKLLAQKVALIKKFGLAFYRPHGEKQDSFHRAGARFRRRMVRAGNRFGKSTMGCAEDCAWLMNERPWYPTTDPARRGGIPQHPVKLLTITTDWDKVDEIFTSQRGEQGKVWRYLPSGFVKSTKRNHSGAIDTIECRNGSLWRFDTVKSFMANPQGSESSDWDAIHVDEPCPEKMWKAASRGLVDRGGAAWFTLTPLSEFWINDFFFPQDTGGQLRDNVWAITCSTYDNPLLSPTDIKEYESGLTDDEKQCRIFGLPLHLSGLIYKAFSWDKHVLIDLPEGWFDYAHPPKDYTFYDYIDPHPQTPHAVLMCAVDPFGRHFFFNDIFEHCSVADLAVRIRQAHDYSFVYDQGIVKPRWTKIDPLAFIDDPVVKANADAGMTSMALEFEDNGIYVERATKALAQGILRCQGELKKPGQIFFTPACRRTLWEIQRYCWDEEENKPLDEDDHMMENFYRAELSDMRYVERNTTASVPIVDIEITRPEFELETLAFKE